MRKLFAFMLLSAISVALPANSVLFENGKTNFKIYHAPGAGSTLLYAVRELRDCLNKISGADFPQTTKEEGPRIVVCVDSALGDPDQVAISTRDGNLYLAGGSSASTLHAVYLFLQKELGVRWFWPGTDGEFIQKKQSWNLSELNYSFQPPIKYRGFHLCGSWRDVDNFRVWMARNFINIHRHGDSRYNALGFYNMHSSHSANLPKSVYEKHPEYFAEINGKRYVNQICFSNPEVDKLVLEKYIELIESRAGMEILSIFPNDNNDYCMCPQCAAKGVTTAWFDFYNRLTDSLKAKYPKLKFATIAYQDYQKVPANPVRNSEFVEYATYARCNIHTFNGKCERNNELLKGLEKWNATGIPMGNYGYEFDIFRDSIFLPFFSMIDDAIKTSLKLKHIAVITEVPLIPKDGPDIDSFAVRNRLVLYLYAQLLWNPQARMTDLLNDWCQNIYSEAAEPMHQYFMTMDHYWSAMPKDRSILGVSAEIARDFLSPELQRKAQDLLAKAGSGPHVEHERIVFNQWLDLLNIENQISVPLKRFTAKLPGVDIRISWDQEFLYFSDMKLPCRIALNNRVGGETMNFELNVEGHKNSWTQSSVGVKNERWQPEWEYRENSVQIPFSSLGGSPQEGTTWSLQVSQNDKVYPVSGMAALRFSSSDKPVKTISWWIGAPDTDRKRHPAIQTDLSQLGWQFKFIESGEELAAGTPDVYWFQHPGGANKVPKENWEKIREDIKNGATAIFSSYMKMPLEEYFDDPSFEIKVWGLPRGTPLSARQTRYVMPGDWISKPHNMTARIKDKHSPPYGVIPAKPQAWRIMATMDVDAQKTNEPQPYLIMRQYGKGTIFVMAVPLIHPPGKLLDNLYHNRNRNNDGL